MRSCWLRLPFRAFVRPTANATLGRLAPAPIIFSKCTRTIARVAFSTQVSNSTLPRTNISLLGATNAGKSVLMNLLTQSDVSLVHDTAGTTADPKSCLMELHGKIGPIRLFDTPGIDEAGELGGMKREKALQTIGQCDVAVIVADPFAKDPASTVSCVVELIQHVQKRQAMNRMVSAGTTNNPMDPPVPLLIFNLRKDKVQELESRSMSISFLIENLEKEIEQKLTKKTTNGAKAALPPTMAVDLAATDELSRDRVINFVEMYARPRLDSVSLLPDSLAHDTHAEAGNSPAVFLNIPMDQQTPSMRLLRPQAMVQEALIRNFVSTYSYRMDLGLARSDNPLHVQKEKDRFLRAIDPFLASGDLKALITDSQAIDLVAPWTLDANGHELVPITTFSITMIRYLSGGRLGYFADGLRKLDQMMAGEALPVNGQKWNILISEACNHTRLNLEKECADIGTVQLPNYLSAKLGSDNVSFEFAFGKHAIFDPLRYDLVVHCGGCMLTPQQMNCRVADLAHAGVAATNYGLLLAKIQSPSTLARVLRPWGVEFDSHERPQLPSAA
ncbi:GTPase Der [Seminavis robusta]|uniref:GTPase Der n=1 Tax=Seminavis robusta TaxID=568900 RepID=A0A9N8ENY0_9STRA|nr:GTPase Der [Seminavis robusta]|eukprot:Sro1555_g282140.1 GTPase Der (559) ;mRNA; r:13176-14852